jgi:hypothetical protein
MNANGAIDLESQDFGNLNHGACAPPAFTATYEFFKSFLISSSTEEYHTIQEINIFPNPTNGTIVIEGIEMEKNNQIRVFDLNGRLMHSSRLSAFNLDLSFLNSGLYLLQITNDQFSHTGRLVIK